MNRYRSEPGVFVCGNRYPYRSSIDRSRSMCAGHYKLDIVMIVSPYIVKWAVAVQIAYPAKR